MAEAAAAVEERRVRPVYEAIDAGNNKLALKLMAQHDRKHGDASGLIRALRALVLERSGKPEEAFALCEEVRGLNPSNEHILNTLLLVYKATGHLQQATDCMEQVSKVNPGDADLISRLFQAYLRQYRFRDMQLAALKLYRIKPDEQHLMWAVTSAFLEAGSAGDVRPLQLAETMVRKHRQKQELQLTQSLLVYLDILKASGKLKEALSTVEQLGSLFSIQVDRLRVQTSLQVQLGKQAEAAATYAKLLDINLDDWSAYTGYFDSTLPSITARMAGVSLNSNSNSNSDNDYVSPSTDTVNGDGVTDAWTAASELVDKLQRRADGGNEIQRGPFLARMELCQRRIECEGAGQQELVDAIVVYFRRFGHLVSFGKDSERAVATVTDTASKDQLLKVLHELAGSADGDNELNVKALRRLISVCEVERQMGLYRSGAVSALSLLSLYTRTLGLSADLDERECGHGDHLITIAATSMVDLLITHQEPKYLLAAVWLLELGLARSRYNYVLRLALLSLHEHLAAAGPALATWEPLEIKHIQLDTLSHHILPVLQAGASWGSLQDLHKAIMKFHSDHRREAADLVMTAFRHGSFNKVKEFVDFKSLLERSHQRAVAVVESTLLKLQERCHSLQEAQALLAEADFGREAEALCHQQQLEFTEDVTTRAAWHPYPDASLLTSTAGNVCSEEAWQSRATQALRCRSLLPRMLWLITSITAAVDDDKGKSSKLETLSELLQTLQQWLRRDAALDAAAAVNAVSEDQEQASEPSVTAGVLAAGVSLFKSVLEPSVPENATTAARALRLVDAAFAQQTKLLCGLLGEATQQGSLPDLYVSPRCGEVMARLTRHAHEDTAWLLLCAQAWSRALQPSLKGKKKKKGSTSQSEPNQTGPSLQAALHEMLKAVSSSLDQLAGRLQAHLSISTDKWLKKFTATLNQLDDSLLASIRSLQDNIVGTRSGRNHIEGLDVVGVFSPVAVSQRSVLDRARDVVLSRNAALLALTRTG